MSPSATMFPGRGTYRSSGSIPSRSRASIASGPRAPSSGAGTSV